MPETFTEDVLEHLSVEQRTINSTINAVHEVNSNKTKYKTAEVTILIAEVKAHDATCTVCANWAGNNRPVPD
jgi:hypothetical protein